jgi:hypothetical protein
MENINKNLELYNKVRSVPQEAKKIIKAGNLKGYTDINPMWRIKILTEQFGMVGIGWYSEITKEWTEQGANNEIIYFVKLKLYIKHDGEWSKPIEGTGGSKLVNFFAKGLTSNDEALKMAETDALSVACKKIGIGADVYFEKDNTKYDLSQNNNKKNNDNNSNNNLNDNNSNNNDEKTKISRIKNILYFASNKDNKEMINILEKETEFKAKDGKKVVGLKDFEKLNGARLNITLAKIEKMYPDIVKKIDNKIKK